MHFAWTRPESFDDDEKQRASTFWAKAQDFMWKAVDYGLVALDAYCLASDAYSVCAMTSAGILNVFSAHLAISGVTAKASSIGGRALSKYVRDQFGDRLRSTIQRSTNAAKNGFRALNKHEMKNLPKNPNDLLKKGYKEITHPEGAKNGHRLFKNPVTDQEIRHDAAKQGVHGHRTKDHYHCTNHSGKTKHDFYLDKDGNPCGYGSDPSHIYPGN